MSQTMKALVIQPDYSVKLQDKPKPSASELGPKEVLFKVLAVGQNPTDWKHVAFKLGEPDCISGCDYVGQALELGSDVPKDVKGTIRFGFVRGGKSKTIGAFSEFIKQEYDLTSEVPKNVTPAQAASAPIPLFTAAQAFYLRLGLPRPDQDNSKVAGKWILVWSGSTAVGQWAIQLAKLAGLRIATTASPAKHELVKSLGAEVVVDYKDPQVSEKLRQATNDSIVYGLDTIAENGSVQLAQKAFGKSGGHLVCTLFDLGEPARSDVKTESTLVYTALGTDQSFGPAAFKTSPEDRANQVQCAKLFTKLFLEGKLKPPQITDVGGIETLEKGMKMLQNGENKTKLVHTIAQAA